MTYTVDDIKNNFECDANGNVWRTSSKRPSTIGRIFSKLNNDGYIQIGFKKTVLKAHHIVWILNTDTLPILNIDHINGIRFDNRFENLREVTAVLNAQNRQSANKNNTTGYLGVAKSRNGKKFRAMIMLNGRNIYLGAFDTPEEAYQVYLNNKRILHPGSTI